MNVSSHVKFGRTRTHAGVWPKSSGTSSHLIFKHPKPERRPHPSLHSELPLRNRSWNVIKSGEIMRKIITMKFAFANIIILIISTSWCIGWFSRNGRGPEWFQTIFFIREDQQLTDVHTIAHHRTLSEEHSFSQKIDKKFNFSKIDDLLWGFE